jgi:thioredoxin
MSVEHVTEKNFQDMIKKDGIVLIDFWAEWCGPCKAFGPVFEKAAEENEDVTFAKCNTEEEQALAGALGIRSIPTLMIFRDNVLIFNQPGMLPEPVLKDVIQKVRELDMAEVIKEVEKAEAEHQHTDDEVQPTTSVEGVA